MSEENGKGRGALRSTPQPHRTVERVTRIVEEVVYNPGMTFSELVRALDAAKSSVHGFIQGLVAAGWLYEDRGRFYLGPAIHALTLASGHIRAGSVSDADLQALHAETGLSVFVGVQAGDDLIYVAEAGTDPVSGFDARTNIRRTMLETAGGKALLAELPPAELKEFLRRRSADEAERVSQFLEQRDRIRQTRIATNSRRNGSRFGMATSLRNGEGRAVAALILVGTEAEILPRTDELAALLLTRAAVFDRRGLRAREAI
jgi:DNA-binding IclR family transcriptional regulator